MLAQYLETGDLPAAMDIFNHATVADVSLSDVLTDTSENTRMTAQVLSIKKPKAKKFQKEGYKFSKIEKQYDRLVLLRELTEGDLFYLLTETPIDTRRLFKVQNFTWIGAMVGLFEPEYKTMLNNVPIVMMEQPLLPIKPTAADRISRPYVVEYTDKLIPRSLYVQQASISVSKVNVITGCGSSFCDSQHDANTQCPGTVTEDIAKRVIQCRISSKEANIANAPFTSATFSKLFLTEHIMKTTSAQIPMLEVRHHINQALQYYSDNDVTWNIAGWYKPGIRANDEQVREPKFHVTAVTPTRVLEDAPLFNVQVDNERQVLEAAIERPCHQRVPAPPQHRQPPAAATPGPHHRQTPQRPNQPLLGGTPRTSPQQRPQSSDVQNQAQSGPSTRRTTQPQARPLPRCSTQFTRTSPRHRPQTLGAQHQQQAPPLPRRPTQPLVGASASTSPQQCPQTTDARHQTQAASLPRRPTQPPAGAPTSVEHRPQSSDLQQPHQPNEPPTNAPQRQPPPQPQYQSHTGSPPPPQQ